MSPRPETIAVFGGTFDPPHIAHVLAACYVLTVARADRLLVVPTYRHPLDKKPVASFEDRLRMCELAFADLHRASVSSVERDLGGPSLSLRTLEEIERREAPAALRLVLGTDLLGEVQRWHQFERITALAPPLVVGRAGHGSVDGVALPEVSSSLIRARLEVGADVSAWVPRAVLEHIRTQGLYVPRHS